MTNFADLGGPDRRPCIPPPPEPPAVAYRSDDLEFQAVLDAFTRWKDAPRVQLDIDRRSAFVLLGALQLAWRHPAAPGKHVLRDIGEQLQNAICDREDIYRVAESGWHPERTV